MKKIIISIMLAVLCLNAAQAIKVQTVRLKNGTVLNGYIQQQDKNENITFRSESAIVCVSGKDATTTDRVYKVGNLEKAWVEWAEKNDLFIGTGDNRTLTLNEIIFRKQEADSVASVSGGVFEEAFRERHNNVEKVKVLEKGINIKYLELTPNTYTFNWSDVESIKGERREKTALSGIDIVYQLKNGQEVRGQYAGESYSTLSLYTAGGMVETFAIDDVVKYFYKPLNPNQTIFEQTELLDVVRTKNSGTYHGVIVERNFADDNGYLVIQQPSGSSQIVKFEDILDLSKEENTTDYSPKFDVILKEGEVLINRIAADSVGVKKQGSTLVLESINKGIVVNKDGNNYRVAVEYCNPHHLTSDHLLLVKLNKSAAKNPTYSFSTDIYEMRKYTAQSTETSVNNTTRLEYVLDGPGVYALYDQNTRKAMPFFVK